MRVAGTCPMWKSSLLIVSVSAHRALQCILVQMNGTFAVPMSLHSSN